MKEIRKRLLKKENFAILYFDLDNFKSINDTYGHACGDRVLVALSEVLSQAVDGKGMVARWGGEEFVIVLKEHDKKAAISFAEPAPSATTIM